MDHRLRAITHSSWQAGLISDKEYMGRYIADVFGLPGQLVTGIRPHRSGHKHRGTRAWLGRYRLKTRWATVGERLWQEHLTRSLIHIPVSCPGCGHSEHRHAGFQCYGPERASGYVGGCDCRWSRRGTPARWVAP